MPFSTFALFAAFVVKKALTGVAGPLERFSPHPVPPLR
jgi:hypothetical protein